MTVDQSSDDLSKALRRAARQSENEAFVQRHTAAIDAIPARFKALKAGPRPGTGCAMKAHPVIDHLLFRKLFAESFSAGSHGVVGGEDYDVDLSGVRWHVTEESYIRNREQQGYAPSDSDTIEYVENIIRPAALPFPCSTAAALIWARRNRDTGEPGDGPNGFIYVPDWLVEALEQEDADGAMCVLADAGQAIYKELAEAQSQGDHEGQKLSRSELRNLNQAIEAFEVIKALLPPVASNPDRLIDGGVYKTGRGLKSARSAKDQAGHDALRLILKDMNATAQSDARSLEPKVREELLKTASRDKDDGIGFKNEGGVLKTKRKGKWNTCDKEALIKRIKTQLARF